MDGCWNEATRPRHADESHGDGHHCRRRRENGVRHDVKALRDGTNCLNEDADRHGDEEHLRRGGAIGRRPDVHRRSPNASARRHDANGLNREVVAHGLEERMQCDEANRQSDDVNLQNGSCP